MPMYFGDDRTSGSAGTRMTSPERETRILYLNRSLIADLKIGVRHSAAMRKGKP